MDRDRMDHLIDEHLGAEDAGDLEAALAVYTEDTEHDVVGAPGGPVRGKAAARARYEGLLQNLHTEKMQETRRFHADAACIVEHLCSATVTGSFGGLAGRDRQVTFRLLHVFEFREDLVSRENVWMDTASVLAQLGTSAPGEPHRP